MEQKLDLTRFVYFSLRTNTEEERKVTDKIIKELKKVFGKETIEIDDFEMWKSITIHGVSGWVGIADIGYSQKSRFHIHTSSCDKRNLNYDIPLDACDTIYCM